MPDSVMNVNKGMDKEFETLPLAEMIQQPVEELEKLRGAKLVVKNTSLPSETVRSAPNGPPICSDARSAGVQDTVSPVPAKTTIESSR